MCSFPDFFYFLNVVVICLSVFVDFTNCQLIINVRNQYGRAPLHWASARGNLDIMEMLVAANCDIEAKDKYGMRPLQMAAWHGHPQAVQMLINLGACSHATTKGGDVVQENISANVSDDTVTLEFQRSDGTLVTQLIDFRNEVQILKSLILGEEERGQSQYQVMCFIFHFPKESFISSDAMAKLRQKNPSTIRTPEEDLGRTNYTMDYVVVLKHSGIISPHVADLCAEAGSATYTIHEDVLKWATAQGIPVTSYKPALKRFPTGADRFLANEVSTEDSFLSNCTDMKNMWTPCECHLELCIGWYPCGLKYCKGKGQSKNSVMSYRCGIKTCRKCYMFAYYVAQKQQCLWDE